MSESNTPYLCGGIFFTLLLQTRKSRTKARDKFQGGSDGLSETDLLKGLVYVVTGEEPDILGDTIRKSTTLFKTCQQYGPTYIPFTDPSTINAFNAGINKKSPDLLKRMSEFIDLYISAARMEWLVKALFEVIESDIEIQNDAVFAVSPVAYAKKQELSSVYRVSLSSFLLSVLSFILNERADNSKGRKTFEEWHEQNSCRSRWKFVSNIGNNTDRSITVLNDPVTENSPEAEEVPLYDAVYESSSKENNSDDSGYSHSQTIIQHQTNVIQNGEKNINMTNNGTINFNF